MKVIESEIAEEIVYLRRGIRAGYKSFKIPLWFAEYLIEILEEKMAVLR